MILESKTFFADAPVDLDAPEVKAGEGPPPRRTRTATTATRRPLWWRWLAGARGQHFIGALVAGGRNGWRFARLSSLWGLICRTRTSTRPSARTVGDENGANHVQLKVVLGVRLPLLRRGLGVLRRRPRRPGDHRQPSPSRCSGWPSCGFGFALVLWLGRGAIVVRALGRRGHRALCLAAPSGC